MVVQPLRFHLARAPFDAEVLDSLHVFVHVVFLLRDLLRDLLARFGFCLGRLFFVLFGCVCVERREQHLLLLLAHGGAVTVQNKVDRAHVDSNVRGVRLCVGFARVVWACRV